MSQRQREPIPVSWRSSINGPIQQELGQSFKYTRAKANRGQLLARSLILPAQVACQTLENGWVFLEQRLKISAGNESNLTWPQGPGSHFIGVAGQCGRQAENLAGFAFQQLVRSFNVSGTSFLTSRLATSVHPSRPFKSQ